MPHSRDRTSQLMLRSALETRSQRLGQNHVDREEQELIQNALETLQIGSRPRHTERQQLWGQPRGAPMRLEPQDSRSSSRSATQNDDAGLLDQPPSPENVASLRPSQRPPQPRSLEHPPADPFRRRGSGRTFVKCNNCSLPCTQRHLLARCGHNFCEGCISVLCSTLNDASFPLTCCSQPLSSKEIESLLPSREVALFRERTAELEVPREKRIYCQNWSRICSAFVCSKDSPQASGQALVCPRCKAALCKQCYHQKHPRQTCAERARMENSQRMDGTIWKSCPNCRKPVEQPVQGNFVTCESGCKVGFCFGCLETTSSNNHQCPNDNPGVEPSPFFPPFNISPESTTVPISSASVETPSDSEPTSQPPPPPAPAASTQPVPRPVYPWTRRANDMQTRAPTNEVTRPGTRMVNIDDYGWLQHRHPQPPWGRGLFSMEPPPPRRPPTDGYHAIPLSAPPCTCGFGHLGHLPPRHPVRFNHTFRRSGPVFPLPFIGPFGPPPGSFYRPT